MQNKVILDTKLRDLGLSETAYYLLCRSFLYLRRRYRFSLVTAFIKTYSDFLRNRVRKPKTGIRRIFSV